MKFPYTRYTFVIVCTVLFVMSSFAKSQDTIHKSQDTIQLSLGGYVEMQYGLSDTDIPRQISQEFLTDIRLYFNAMGTSRLLSEYGVHQYGVNIELDLEGTVIQIEEGHLFFEHRFGTFVLGDTDGASDTLAVYAPVDTWTDRLDDDWESFLNRQEQDSRILAQHVFTAIDSGGSTKVVYYTPERKGIQIGFSYAPEGGESVLATGTARSMGDSVTTQDSQERFYDYLALGIKYEYIFTRYRVLLGFTGTRFSFTPDVTSNVKRADYWTWQTGGQVTYTWSEVKEQKRLSFGGGFTHFGHYDTPEDGMVADEYDFAWNIGLEYEDGPMTVGLGYYHVQGSYNRKVTSIADVIGLGWRYKLTQDLTLQASLTRYIFDIEDRERAVFGFHNMDPIQGGTVVIAGLHLAF